MIAPLLGILIVAVISASGDYLWYALGVRHTVMNGVLHGVALLLGVGAVIGAASGRLLAGLPIGIAAGVIGALTFYAISPVVGRSAMIVAWGSLWIVLAILDGRFIRRPTRSLSSSLTYGAVAAILGAISFSLVVGTLWGRPPAGGRNVFLQIAAWAFAWAPGILALTWRTRTRA